MLIGHATASNSYNYQAGYMQLGPDNRIYITRYGTHYLAVINSPNNYGLDCGFQNDGVFLGEKTSTAGLSRAPKKTSFPAFVPVAVLQEPALTVFPNPSNGNFTLMCSHLRNGEEIYLEIIDQPGKPVVQKRLKFNESQALCFPGLKTGLYSLRVKTGHGTYVSKIAIRQFPR